MESSTRSLRVLALGPKVYNEAGTCMKDAEMISYHLSPKSIRVSYSNKVCLQHSRALVSLNALNVVRLYHVRPYLSESFLSRREICSRAVKVLAKNKLPWFLVVSAIFVMLSGMLRVRSPSR